MLRIGISRPELVISVSTTRYQHISMERSVTCLKSINKNTRCEQGYAKSILKANMHFTANHIYGLIFGSAIDYKVQTLETRYDTHNMAQIATTHQPSRKPEIRGRSPSICPKSFNQRNQIRNKHW